MKLDLVKGFETSLIIDNVDVSIEENGFLGDSYKKARDVLKTYASQTDKIREELKHENNISGVNDCLYRSPQNIIAFSGRRGIGKTSTMLSFVQSLVTENSKTRKEALQERGVVVLDPIDPTMLENDQNILNVVLSRLLNKAEEVWMESMDYNRRYQDKEKEKNEILSIAKKCLSGIAAIKSRSSMETLSDLQKIGDSAILKRDFFELVEILNRFALSSAKGYPLLVLQIDDTDCQISKGYQVMEDIRKYLTIPNVVIFMAVDIDMMRLVLTQHYIGEFNSDLKEEFIEKKEIRHYADKYMAKLLPPAHKIYLPAVDEIIRDQSDSIELGYYEAEDVKKNNNILKRGESFQTRILNFIYQKTHLVFAAHGAYLNNIVPTTLRGLSYFLNILSSMEDVPEIDFSKVDDTAALIEEMENQLPILERNLDIFEDYFMNDWIQAKLSHEMIAIMEKTASRVPEERIIYAYKEFWNYYDKKGGVYELADKPTYYDLDKLLQQILGTTNEQDHSGVNSFRELEDFYNIFSIRTLLSIKNNKDMVRIKRRAMKERAGSSTDKLILDFSGSKLSMPDSLYLDDKELNGCRVVNGGSKKIYNFLDDIIKCLFKKSFESLGMTQKQIFIKQEIAVLIACNFEVQEVIRKAVKKIKLEETCESIIGTVEAGFKKVQKAVSKINDGMLERYIEKDVSPFIYSHCQNEMRRQENEKVKQQQQQQKAFEYINLLLAEIMEYPRLKNDKKIEDINGKIKDITQDINEYITKYLANQGEGKEFEKLSKKLTDYKFVFDKEDNLNNKQDLDDLIQELCEFIKWIAPQAV